MRKSLFAVLLALSAILGAYAPVAAAQVSSAKVVIIVGADTPQYVDDANELYAEAIQHTPNVIRVYSPNATWAAVKAATTGANVVIYLGHGNGWPSPYTYDPSYTTKDGFGLNAVGGGSTTGNLKYYGEPYIRTLALAPNAIIFLHHLCYASGNSEPGGAAPTLSIARQRVDNYGAAYLAAGASAVVADGHSHTGYYLRALFTTAQPLGQWWRGAPNYHAHDIGFTPSRSTGTAILDPDTGGSSPAGFYRSFVGNQGVVTASVTGVTLSPGVRGTPGVAILPGRDSVSSTGTVGAPRTFGGASIAAPTPAEVPRAILAPTASTTPTDAVVPTTPRSGAAPTRPRVAATRPTVAVWQTSKAVASLPIVALTKRTAAAARATAGMPPSGTNTSSTHLTGRPARFSS